LKVLQYAIRQIVCRAIQFSAIVHFRQSGYSFIDCNCGSFANVEMAELVNSESRQIGVEFALLIGRGIDKFRQIDDAAEFNGNVGDAAAAILSFEPMKIVIDTPFGMSVENISGLPNRGRRI